MSDENAADFRRQAMRPHGLMGRIFAALMERTNERACRWVVAQRPNVDGLRLYELGFGTGRLLELFARTGAVRLVRGVDPSDLMLSMTTARLERYAKTMDVDIRLGDDASDNWPEQEFDLVAALHAFQFWAKPEATLTRLRQRIARNGALILVLRAHRGADAPKWLPNPISRGGDEVAHTIALLKACGFDVAPPETVANKSTGLIARPR